MRFVDLTLLGAGGFDSESGGYKTTSRFITTGGQIDSVVLVENMNRKVHARSAWVERAFCEDPS